MIKVICTTQKEKTELIEASQFLASLKGNTSNLKTVSWLTNLYKNPGDIEVMEEGLNVNRIRHQSKKSPYEPRGLKDLFDL